MGNTFAVKQNLPIKNNLSSTTDISSTANTPSSDSFLSFCERTNCIVLSIFDTNQNEVSLITSPLKWDVTKIDKRSQVCGALKPSSKEKIPNFIYANIRFINHPKFSFACVGEMLFPPDDIQVFEVGLNLQPQQSEEQGPYIFSTQHDSKILYIFTDDRVNTDFPLQLQTLNSSDEPLNIGTDKKKHRNRSTSLPPKVVNLKTADLSFKDSHEFFKRHISESRLSVDDNKEPEDSTKSRGRTRGYTTGQKPESFYPLQNYNNKNEDVCESNK